MFDNSVRSVGVTGVLTEIFARSGIECRRIGTMGCHCGDRWDKREFSVSRHDCCTWWSEASISACGKNQHLVVEVNMIRSSRCVHRQDLY